MKKAEKIRIYLQPAFVMCVLVLAAAGAGRQLAIDRLGLFLQKEPIPLQKSLDLLDDNNLSPFIIKPENKRNIQNNDTLKSLGTEQYILWDIQDSSAEPGSLTSKFSLFITYYDSPDKVPHVPEECYAGSGFEQIESDSLMLKIDNGAGFQRKIPAKYLVFSDKTTTLEFSAGAFPVIYFFRVNDQYTGSREETRIVLNKNFVSESSYFSKVELAFNQSKKAPGPEQAIEAVQKLLSVILPFLEENHWPEYRE
jgi:hypothetical protein